MTRENNPWTQQAKQRDRDVRRAGRARAALVGGATAASVGIAGVLGVAGLTATPTSSGTPTSPAAPSQGTQQPQKTGLVADLHTFGSGQQLSNGSGTAHATTKGS